MFFESTLNKHKLRTFVKEVFLVENQQVGIRPERLSFFADGFPGLVFLQTEAPVYQLPKGKLLSSLFIYGQTIHPLELELTGAYQMIAFQLQPYAVRVLFGVDPKELNDDCFDLSMHHADTLQCLRQSSTATERAESPRILGHKVLSGLFNFFKFEARIFASSFLKIMSKIWTNELAKNLRNLRLTLQRTPGWRIFCL